MAVVAAAAVVAVVDVDVADVVVAVDVDVLKMVATKRV